MASRFRGEAPDRLAIEAAKNHALCTTNGVCPELPNGWERTNFGSAVMRVNPVRLHYQLKDDGASFQMEYSLGIDVAYI